MTIRKNFENNFRFVKECYKFCGKYSRKLQQI